MNKIIIFIICINVASICLAQEKTRSLNSLSLSISPSLGIFLGGEKNAVYTELSTIGLDANLPLSKEIDFKMGIAYKFSISNSNFLLSEYEVNFGLKSLLNTKRFFYYGIEVGIFHSVETYIFQLSEQNITGSIRYFGYSLKPIVGFHFGKFTIEPQLEIEPNLKTVISCGIGYEIQKK